MKRSVVTLLAASAFALLTRGVLAQGLDANLYVDSKDPGAANALSKLVGSKARIASRLGRSLYKIQTSPAREAEVRALLVASGYRITRTDHTADGPGAPSTSLGSISARLAEAKRLKLLHGGRGYGVSYLESLQYFTKRRAFPYDSIDYGAINRAASNRHILRDFYNPDPGGRMGPNDWQFVGPRNLDIPYRTYYGTPPLGGRTNAVAFDPSNANTYYVGGANGGVWKTTDGGLAWTPLSNDWDNQPVNTIFVKDSSTIFVGLGDVHGNIGYGSGIYRSTNGGVTWAKVGTSTFSNSIGVTRIVGTGPTNNVLLASTGGPSDYWGGIYRSTDGGVSWTRVENTANLSWTGMSASNIGGVRTVYAACGGYGNDRIYKSTDDGQTWAAVTVPGLNAGSFRWGYDVAASKLSANTVYVLAPTEQKILRSIDGGTNWTEIQSGMETGGGYNWSQYYYNYHCSTGVIPDAMGVSQDALYVGNIDLSVYSTAFGAAPWKSIGGPSWSGSASVLHNDQHCFAISPLDSSVGLAGCDGGVFRINYSSVNASFTVTPLNRNMFTHMFYHLDVHPTADDTMLGGTQDNAGPLVQGDLLNWSNVAGGDGAYSAINRDNPAIQFSSAQGLEVVKTVNNWATQSWISPSWGSQRPAFIAPFELNQGNQNELIAGTNFLWKYDTAGNTWTQLGTTELATGGTSISAIETTPDENRIFIGSEGGDLWETTNKGTSYRGIIGNLPDRTFTDIDSLNTNNKNVLVTLGGTGTGHVYLCTDIDATTPVWTDISGTGANRLPDVPTNTIVRDPQAPTQKFWVGNDLGVFVTLDGGATWMDATRSMGLPIVIVNKLHYDPRSLYLYAGTFGRGIWRAKIGFTGLTGLTLNPNSVTRGTTAPVVATVTMASSATASRTVSITGTGVPSGTTFPSSVVVPANQTSASFNISVQNSSSTGTATFKASYDGIDVTSTLGITNPVASTLTLDPPAVIGGNTSTATLALTGQAVPGGQVFSLSSSNTGLATVPATVTVPAGQSSATFLVTSKKVATSSNVTITAGGKTASLEVQPSNMVSLTATGNETSAGNGVPISGKVTLGNHAPSSGVLINLSSSNSAALAVPATVGVSPNTLAASFAMTPGAVVNPVQVTITAKQVIGATTLTQTVKVTVHPRFISSVSIVPASVLAGRGAQGKVTISGPAPAGYAAVKLVSAHPGVTVPATVAVAPGATTALFAVTTAGTVTGDPLVYVTASYGGASKLGGIRVCEYTVDWLRVNPNPVKGGLTTTCTVNMPIAAPAGGLTLTTVNLNPAVLTLPATVTVPAGSKTTTFTISTNAVAANTAVSINVNYKGAGAGAVVTVTP